MKTILSIFTLVLLQACPAFSQQINFALVAEKNRNNWGGILAIAQDQEGYIWFTTSSDLHRYDGANFINYRNDPRDPNSLTGNRAESLTIDSAGIIWVGTFDAGLNRLDPLTNTFTHFRHNQQDLSSLSNDTVTAILEDHLGNLWVGTYGGLDLLNKKTGKFIHYPHKLNDTSSLSNNQVRVIYEDHHGELWIGCGSPFDADGQKKEEGGLNWFNRTNGKFMRYLHDPANPNSIASNKVSAIFEDSKENFWIGTAGDGLHTMDRAKGIFTHYYYDPAYPEKLSRPPLNNSLSAVDHITFINEDATGAMWIGTYLCGINRYSQETKKVTHYGYITTGDISILRSDTTTGFKDYFAWRSFSSKDGLFWICTLNGGLFKVNLFKTTMPYYAIKQRESNSLYCETNGNILWIATDDGLLRKNLVTQSEKLWVHDPSNDNTLSNNMIFGMRADDEGKIWLGTVGGGLDKFDPVTGKFVHFKYDINKPGSICSNQFNYLYIDHNKNLWAATDSGIAKMDKATSLFINYRHNSNDSNSLIGDVTYCIAEDKDHSMWAGTVDGVSRLNNKSGKFRSYPSVPSAKSICVDSKGVVWVGGTDGLYYFDTKKDQFILYADQNSPVVISGVLGIIEDDNKNLWISTSASIVKINSDRNEVKNYGEEQGVRYNQMGWCDNFKGRDGKLFLADWNGYYAFYPDQLRDKKTTPQVIFTSFKLNDQEVAPSKSSVLDLPVWKAKEIKLNYDQNTFSLDFAAIEYYSADAEKFLFMLENYDNTWHNIGTDHKAYFFNVPPGTYVFHAKAVDNEGGWDEKTISIIITPPWWRTWWAYCIYGILFIVAIYAVHRVQKQRVISAERERTRKRDLAQAKEIEKAYKELKTTQTQLIQSEKMASLGELTAGIAHEIQNPLNFVNNFSEVNKELIEEMQQEMDNGNLNDAKAISNDIKENEEKIIHHGKRADSIVKGMLQHTRVSTGQKELIDLNTLADEYLRLSYHGMRAKDKTFNATLQTDFETSLEKINAVPQDIGRVLLNLFNNAFYAVQKKKELNADYEPTVSVSTKKFDGKIEIHVRDNGVGIPQKVVDKIFQPFFTTKPTGQGTGLGLSLTYDIIKAHGGEIRVETKEGEGSEFVIQLPMK
jgi:ligand-binding sensor domain-containing protein/signal transduction histidine kinase